MCGAHWVAAIPLLEQATTRLQVVDGFIRISKLPGDQTSFRKHGSERLIVAELTPHFDAPVIAPARLLVVALPQGTATNNEGRGGALRGRNGLRVTSPIEWHSTAVASGRIGQFEQGSQPAPGLRVQPARIPEEEQPNGQAYAWRGAIRLDAPVERRANVVELGVHPAERVDGQTWRGD